MTALYLDTSALFKRYVEEAESEDVLARIDAVQLAAALAWREAPNDMEEDIVFACFDQDLRRAATAEGLLVWPREEA